MKLSVTAITLFFLIAYPISGQVNDTNLKKIETGNWLELSVKQVNDQGEEMPFVASVDEMPKYPRGFNALAKFIIKNLEYPKSAIEDNIEGRVLTSFIVNSRGQVDKIKVIEGVRNDLDSTCIQTLNKMPDWSPVTNRNIENISFQFYLPIRFLLQDPKRKK